MDWIRVIKAVGILLTAITSVVLLVYLLAEHLVPLSVIGGVAVLTKEIYEALEE